MRYAIVEPIEKTGGHHLIKLNLTKETAKELGKELLRRYPGRNLQVSEDVWGSDDDPLVSLMPRDKGWEAVVAEACMSVKQSHTSSA
ncbi:hypothetical protein J7J84_03385 [bacterium]|nr:hypothetical protein [bacterium]